MTFHKPKAGSRQARCRQRFNPSNRPSPPGRRRLICRRPCALCGSTPAATGMRPINASIGSISQASTPPPCGFMPICTARKAIYGTSAIGVAAPAVRRRPARLRRNGGRSPRRCWRKRREWRDRARSRRHHGPGAGDAARNFRLRRFSAQSGGLACRDVLAVMPLVQKIPALSIAGGHGCGFGSWFDDGPLAADWALTPHRRLDDPLLIEIATAADFLRIIGEAV